MIKTDRSWIHLPPLSCITVTADSRRTEFLKLRRTLLKNF